ncbi:MAG: SDR family NAD(P)-dependent oxidoreductase [Gammaproteobacteria bacterium]
MNRNGQTVVVIGAGGGLGSGLAARFAAQGATVVLAGIDTQELAGVERAVRARGARAEVMRVDVADGDDVDAFARAVVARHGRVDLLCNTVGVGAQGQSWGLSMPSWHWQFDVNLFGAVHLNRAFVPAMIQAGTGHVAHTVSTSALTTHAGNPAYVASKHALLSVCESLQQDLRAAGAPIRVSAIVPGAIRSRMYEGHRHRQARYGAGEVDPAQIAASRDYLESFGADPDVLAGIVGGQLDAGLFYVFGRPEDRQYAARRCEDILRGTLSEPSFARVPGPGARALQGADGNGPGGSR